MFRRTFIKSFIIATTIPKWIGNKTKQTLSHFELIKKLLKRKKNFSVICRKDKLLVNIVRPKQRKIDLKQAMIDRLNIDPEVKKEYDINHSLSQRKQYLNRRRPRHHKLDIKFRNNND